MDLHLLPFIGPKMHNLHLKILMVRLFKVLFYILNGQASLKGNNNKKKKDNENNKKKKRNGSQKKKEQRQKRREQQQQQGQLKE